MKRIYSYIYLNFTLIILIISWNACLCNQLNVKYFQDEDVKKTLSLIYWLKNTYPESDRAKWDEVCNLLVNWSIADTNINVIVNVNTIEELLNDQKYLYQEESIKIYVLTTIAYCLERNYECNAVNASYMGLLSVIDFYKVIKANNNSITSKAIDDYISLEQKGKLKDLVVNKSKILF